MSLSIDTLHSRECRLFRPSASGNSVHSVVPIRLSISRDAGRQPNEGQPNESHGNKQRTAWTQVLIQPGMIRQIGNYSLLTPAVSRDVSSTSAMGLS